MLGRRWRRRSVTSQQRGCFTGGELKTYRCGHASDEVANTIASSDDAKNTLFRGRINHVVERLDWCAGRAQAHVDDRAASTSAADDVVDGPFEARHDDRSCGLLQYISIFCHKAEGPSIQHTPELSKTFTEIKLVFFATP